MKYKYVERADKIPIDRAVIGRRDSIFCSLAKGRRARLLEVIEAIGLRPEGGWDPITTIESGLKFKATVKGTPNKKTGDWQSDVYPIKTEAVTAGVTDDE